MTDNSSAAASLQVGNRCNITHARMNCFPPLINKYAYAARLFIVTCKSNVYYYQWQIHGRGGKRSNRRRLLAKKAHTEHQICQKECTFVPYLDVPVTEAFQFQRELFPWPLGAPPTDLCYKFVLCACHVGHHPETEPLHLSSITITMVRLPSVC